MTIALETHCKLPDMHFGGRPVGSPSDIADRGEEVWAEAGDGSCRWRQTASEVTLLCLGVPPHTPAKQLQVTVDPYFIKGTVCTFITHFLSFSVVRHGHLPTQSLSLMLHLSACCLCIHPVCPISYMSQQHCQGSFDCCMQWCPAVVDKLSGGVYLEGHLERGIVPEESVWEHGGGVGENGCLLYLHKMNLQLLRK